VWRQLQCVRDACRMRRAAPVDLWPGSGHRGRLDPRRQEYSFPFGAEKLFPRYDQLYTISTEGGSAHEVPLPMGYEGSYSADGARLAYTPLPREIFFVGVPLVHAFWAHYRGGLAPQVWIANLANSEVVKVPHENASDFSPIWVGNKIYFLSARTEPITLYAYDVATKSVTRVIENHGMDMMSASAGPGAIVYEQFGSLHLYDLASGRTREVPVTIRGDFPEIRTHFEKVADHVM